MRESYRPEIYQGVLGEFNQAVQKVTDAHAKLQHAYHLEIRRWNPRELNDNMQLFRARLAEIFDAGNHPLEGGVSLGDQARALYAEAQAAGDAHILRAAAEVFKGAMARTDSIPGQEKQKVFQVVRQAERDLREMRDTQELRDTSQALVSAKDELLSKREELAEVSRWLDGKDPAADIFARSPLTQAFRRVKFEAGEMTVLPSDHPEATGIEIHFEENLTA